MGCNYEATDDPIELPGDFADHVATIIDADTPPATLEEWWTAAGNQYEEEGLTVGFEDLYSETPTRHEVQVNGRVRYTHCALDALLAAVMEEQASVTVRSIDPITATAVTITISDDAVEVSPEGAVICFGSNIDRAAVEAAGSLAAWSLQDDKAEIQASVCQYTNAFESTKTYETWASASDSVSAPLPPDKVVPFLREVPFDRT